MKQTFSFQFQPYEIIKINDPRAIISREIWA